MEEFPQTAGTRPGPAGSLIQEASDLNEKKKNTVLGYVFLIPSLIVFAAFMFYPLAKTIYLSFFDWNMIKPVKKFVGLANYKLILPIPTRTKSSEILWLIF